MSKCTLKVGDFYEDCGYHPLVLFDIHYYDYDTEKEDPSLTGLSLIDYKKSSCSWAHCGVIPLTLEDVKEHIKVFNKAGINGLAQKYGGNS